MESDTKANIVSDHYPVIGTSKTKLRGTSTLGKHRCRYEKCTEEEMNKMNQALSDNTANDIKAWLNTGAKALPKEKPRDRFRKSQLSFKTRRIVGERGRARKERNLEEFTKLSKEYKKSRQEDRKTQVPEAISKDLDLRSRWLGIKELKSKYNTTPYHDKIKKGSTLNYMKEHRKQQNTLAKNNGENLAKSIKT